MMTRRGFLASAAAAPAPPRPSRPNIVFILADDAGYGDFGCYGQKKIATPNIDRMASEGMRFLQHYAGDSVCAPSRCSLMTGLHTGHTPIRGNKEIKGYGPLAVTPETLTVARVLQSAGYATGMTGRWHLGELSSQSQPHQMGFDYFIGALASPKGPDPNAYFRSHLREGDKPVALSGNVDGRRVTYDQDVLTMKAEAYIRARRDNPFFLYVPYSLVHTPYMDPGSNPYAGREWPEVERTYAGMVSRLDGYVGRLLAAVSEAGIENETVVFFSSDNGPEQGGGHLIEFFDSNGPFRGGKRDLYEGGIRIPLIARWPGRITPRATTNHASAFCDFLPTAAEIAGVQPPRGIDGLSYLPTLLGRPQQVHSHLYWELHERKKVQAVRSGHWKAVGFAGEDRIELYDLGRDPAEQQDLAAKHPDKVADLARLMQKSRTVSAEFPLPGDPVVGGTR